MDDRPFHEGEWRAQILAGGGASGADIRSFFMPDKHRAFFANLPILFLGLPDQDGWPLATAITGQPGFISSPSPSVLRIKAELTESDPGSPNLRDGVESVSSDLRSARDAATEQTGSSRADFQAV